MTAGVRTRTATAPGGVARLLAAADRGPALAEHLATYGPLPRATGLAELATRAGLRGRGGAAFPTGRKLEAVAAQRGQKVVVANGAEGEPTSKKDRSLLRVAPHLVLDGAELSAHAVGEREAIVAVSRPAPELEAAVRERRGAVSFEVRLVPDRFVAGEETALLRAVDGRAAKPTRKPPYPFERGLRGRPTLVQNVETLAHLALLARFGPKWFGGGTALVTLGGAVAQPGVHEIPLGLTLADALARCGGLEGAVDGYLVGGYFGRFVTAADAAATELNADTLGAGAIVAVPSSTCLAAEVAHVADYLAGESAGQCGPCVHGLRAIADALAVERKGDRRADIERWTAMVAGRGACRHPDGASGFVRSALEVFPTEFAHHAKHRGCGRRYLGVLPVGGGA